MNSIILPLSLHPIHKENLIRIGTSNDGGYVITKEILDQTNFLLSFGINDDWNFEREFQLKARNNISIHAYDHTTNERLFTKNIIKHLLKNIFKPWNLSWQTIFLHYNYKKFFDGETNVHFNSRVWWSDEENSISIENIFKKISSDKIFLKIDIEGSEYRIIDEVLKKTDRIIGMVIEFHNLDILYDVWLKIMENLSEKFNIAHIHANNYAGIGKNNFPVVLEITFEKKEISSQILSKYSYPINGVDQSNDPNKPDLSLIFK